MRCDPWQKMRPKIGEILIEMNKIEKDVCNKMLKKYHKEESKLKS